MRASATSDEDSSLEGHRRWHLRQTTSRMGFPPSILPSSTDFPDRQSGHLDSSVQARVMKVSSASPIDRLNHPKLKSPHDYSFSLCWLSKSGSFLTRTEAVVGFTASPGSTPVFLVVRSCFFV